MSMEDLPFRSLSLEGPLFQNKELIEPFGDSVLVPVLYITHQTCPTTKKNFVYLSLFGLVGFCRTSWSREIEVFSAL